jgi:UDP-glucose 4-epimerase
MRCLVTGAAGFLGVNLVEFLSEKGYKVIATDIPTSDFSEIKKFCEDIIPCDLTSDTLSELFKKDIDVLIHTAGIFDLSANPKLMRRVNVDAVERICRASLGKVGLFIHISSTGIYGKPEKIPADENTNPKPRNHYEKTKKEGEDVVKTYIKMGINAVILRPTLMYGPRSKYGYAMLIGLYSLAREKGKKVLPSVKGGPMTHSVHVLDVAHAVDVATKRFFSEKISQDSADSRIFNVADDTPLPFGDMLEVIANACGVELKKSIPYFAARPLTLLISHLPIYDDLKEKVLNIWFEVAKEKNLNTPLRPRLDREWNDYFAGDFMYSTEKIKKIGFKPKFTFKEGIEQTVKWYRENKWIP